MSVFFFLRAQMILKGYADIYQRRWAPTVNRFSTEPDKLYKLTLYLSFIILWWLNIWVHILLRFNNVTCISGAPKHSSSKLHMIARQFDHFFSISLMASWASSPRADRADVHHNYRSWWSPQVVSQRHKFNERGPSLCLPLRVASLSATDGTKWGPGTCRWSLLSIKYQLHLWASPPGSWPVQLNPIFSANDDQWDRTFMSVRPYRLLNV